MSILNNSKAFCSFAVDDLEKARAFYENTLGLTVKDHPMGILELHVASSEPIIVYPRTNHVPAEYTVLNFPTEKIEPVVDELISRGITFEQYSELDTDEKRHQPGQRAGYSVVQRSGGQYHIGYRNDVT